MFIAEAFDCANCEVTLSQPLPENDNVIELYDALPQKYDAFSGVKDMSAEGVQFVFKIYDIHPDLWEDYYNRLMFFHRAFLDEKDRIAKRKQRREESKNNQQKGMSKGTNP